MLAGNASGRPLPRFEPRETAQNVRALAVYWAKPLKTGFINAGVDGSSFAGGPPVRKNAAPEYRGGVGYVRAAATIKRNSKTLAVQTPFQNQCQNHANDTGRRWRWLIRSLAGSSFLERGMVHPVIVGLIDHVNGRLYVAP
jgi:hypothetical protein